MGLAGRDIQFFFPVTAPYRISYVLIPYLRSRPRPTVASERKGSVRGGDFSGIYDRRADHRLLDTDQAI